MDVLDRLTALNMTQVELLFELRRRGVNTQPSELSPVLRGVVTYPKAKKIYKECDKIVTDWETERNRRAAD